MKKIRTYIKFILNILISILIAFSMLNIKTNHLAHSNEEIYLNNETQLKNDIDYGIENKSNRNSIITPDDIHELEEIWRNSYEEIKSGENIIGFKTTEEINLLDEYGNITKIEILAHNNISGNDYEVLFLPYAHFNGELFFLFPEDGNYDITLRITSHAQDDEEWFISFKEGIEGKNATDVFFTPWINSFEEIYNGEEIVGFKTNESIDYSIVGNIPINNISIYITQNDGEREWTVDQFSLKNDWSQDNIIYYFSEENHYDAEYPLDISVIFTIDIISIPWIDCDAEYISILGSVTNPSSIPKEDIANEFYKPWQESFVEIKENGNTIGFEINESINLYDIPLPDHVFLQIKNGDNVLDEFEIEVSKSTQPITYYFANSGTLDVLVRTEYLDDGDSNNVYAPIKTDIVVKQLNTEEYTRNVFEPWFNSFTKIELYDETIGFKTTEGIDFTSQKWIQEARLIIKKYNTVDEVYEINLEGTDEKIEYYFDDVGEYEITIETTFNSKEDEYIVTTMQLSEPFGAKDMYDVYFIPWINSFEEIKDGENVIGYKVTESVDLSKIDGTIEVISWKDDKSSVKYSLELKKDGTDDTFEFYFPESGNYSTTVYVQDINGVSHPTNLSTSTNAVGIYDNWINSFELIYDKQYQASSPDDVIGFKTTTPIDLTKFNFGDEDNITIEILEEDFVVEAKELKTDGTNNTFELSFPKDGNFDIRINTYYNGRNYYCTLANDVSAKGMDLNEMHETELENFVEPIIKGEQTSTSPDGLYWSDISLDPEIFGEDKEVTVEFINLETNEIVETETIETNYYIPYYAFEPMITGEYQITASTYFSSDEKSDEKVTVIIDESVFLDYTVPPVIEEPTFISEHWKIIFGILLTIIIIVTAIILSQVLNKKNKSSK